MSEFQKRVIQVVRLIPEGSVMSYGQVAVYVGAPRAARQVGWILRSLEGEDMPWWRVVNNAGRITIKGNLFATAELQKKLLEAEGLLIANDFTFNIKEYRHIPTNEELKQMTLSEEYITTIREQYGL